MTIGELIDKLRELDEDDVIVYTDADGGWANIELDISTSSQVSIVPCVDDVFH